MEMDTIPMMIIVLNYQTKAKRIMIMTAFLTYQTTASLYQMLARETAILTVLAMPVMLKQTAIQTEYVMEWTTARL